jgi:hypothetical protein
VILKIDTVHCFNTLDCMKGLESLVRMEGTPKIATSRCLFALLSAILILVIAPASAVNRANPDIGKAGGAERSLSSELAGGWHFVRTRNPEGGPDAISIMHTADTSRSDLDLAGLMIRCGERGAEVVIVLIRSFPLRARPHVVLGKPGTETQFDAKVAPPGTAVLLPRDAITLVSGPWQTISDLFIQVSDGQTAIRGVVALVGLQAAYKALLASCPVR